MCSLLLESDAFDDGNEILTELEYCINAGVDINTLSNNNVADFTFTKKFANGEMDKKSDDLFYNLNKASYGGFGLFCNFMSKLARS